MYNVILLVGIDSLDQFYCETSLRNCKCIKCKHVKILTLNKHQIKSNQESSCERKETVDIDTLATSRNGYKIMLSIKINLPQE